MNAFQQQLQAGRIWASGGTEAEARAALPGSSSSDSGGNGGGFSLLPLILLAGVGFVLMKGGVLDGAN